MFKKKKIVTIAENVIWMWECDGKMFWCMLRWLEEQPSCSQANAA